MPQTVYRIAGTSTTKPTDLPEGFTVEEKREPITVHIVTGLSRKVEVIEHAEGINLDVTEVSPFRSRRVPTMLNRTETRKLRDALSAALGDEPAAEAGPKLRSFKDRDGDVWHEGRPGRFLCGDRESVGRMFARGGAAGVDLAEVRDLYGPLTEVTDGDAPKLRAFIDCDNDKWFEVEPNRFRIGGNRADAERRDRAFPGGETHEQISTYAPLTEITE
jgi:hypothetical protein